MKISHSSRLSYQFIGKQDNEFLFQLDQNPKVMRYISNGKKTSKHDISNLFIPRLYAYRNEEKGWGLWKVTITQSQEDIGWILVRPMNFFSNKPNFQDLELGWRFKESSWGKGYATEAALHIKNELSKQTDIKTFSASALVENKASINVMKKLGMIPIKHYIHIEIKLEERNAVLYKIDNK